MSDKMSPYVLFGILRTFDQNVIRRSGGPLRRSSDSTHVSFKDSVTKSLTTNEYRYETFTFEFIYSRFAYIFERFMIFITIRSLPSGDAIQSCHDARSSSC